MTARETNPPLKIADRQTISPQANDLSALIGGLPYRLALAGGWIDQPFVSRHNPDPPGSMVVVSLQPVFRFMDRCGMATSTRNAAIRLWGDRLPDGDPAILVRQLYVEENKDKADPSGSQDMAGIIYAGISRLDYDYAVDGGVFPSHVESCRDAAIAAWLEENLHLLPIEPRPAGYDPLGVKNLDSAWIRRLGASGRDCYEAILARDLSGLGKAMNECMRCWEAILPNTVRHPTLHTDLMGLLAWYQRRHAGAMYSGCGGGYLIVASAEPVPGSFGIKIRLDTRPSI
jgi:hypothetical protein